ncbi:MAG: MFS transporter [Aestuariibacter sp.]|nr:MFS transporter [Aestuariibacter sp.]
MHLGFLSLLACTAFVSAALGFSFPLLDFSLNRMEATGSMIGINAAMPALGWLLVTPFLPFLQHTFGTRRLLLVFLAIAIAAMVGFWIFPDIWLWIPLRFLFGGSIGIFFRIVEFWVNSASPRHQKGRNIGIYAAIFCAGAATGAALVAVVGSSGWQAHLFVCVLLSLGAFSLAGAKSAIPEITAPPNRSLSSFVLLLPVAMAGVLIWGMFESVPYSFMPIYALRVGLSEEWAALTMSAFVLGGFAFPIPLGMLADRVDKQKLLLSCGGFAFMMAFLMPQTLFSKELFLFSLFVWGGVGGGLYTVSLAVIGEHFNGASLAASNAAFGTLYAFGAMIGPILNGAAMDVWNPDGLLVYAAILFGSFVVIAGWWLARRATAPVREIP